MDWLTKSTNCATKQENYNKKQKPQGRNLQGASKLVWFFALCGFLTHTSACAAHKDVSTGSVKYCNYTYSIHSGSVRFPVCSQYSLSKLDLEHLTRQLNSSLFLYRKFAKANGLTLPDRSTVEDLDIYLTTYAHLNDPAYFPRYFKGSKIVGRYINKRADIFLTKRALIRKSNSDFPHELAHWFNDIMGVKDRETNEALALSFERYYQARTR